MAFSDWASVGSSSHVDAVRFDTESGILQVRYSNGSVYEWYGVQEDVAIGATTAPSPGRYLNTHVEGQYGKGSKVS